MEFQTTYQKCHSNQQQHQPPQQKDGVYNQEIKKHKTVHNNDVSTIRVSQKLCLQRTLQQTEKDKVSVIEMQLFLNQKVPNPLEILEPESNPISKELHFKLHFKLKNPNQFQKQLIHLELLNLCNLIEMIIYKFQEILQKEILLFKIYKKQIIKFHFRKNLIYFLKKENLLVVKTVQKTQQITKPYFESNKGEDIQNNNFTNRLECRKIMIILDQDKEKILDLVASIILKLVMINKLFQTIQTDRNFTLIHGAIRSKQQSLREAALDLFSEIVKQIAQREQSYQDYLVKIYIDEIESKKKSKEEEYIHSNIMMIKILLTYAKQDVFSQNQIQKRSQIIYYEQGCN
ncbi:unnamed protein product [Paramecium sonneborni]|uniref:Uncharacterized protein n=1 Tax=Paramecium sonneborni TaxID=65129 RepID=A0A8S1RU64_9CILI|nr:unnamed protein product [Paramecium sonneborni]